MLSGRADATFQPLPYEGGSRLKDADRALARIPVAVWLLGIVALSALFRYWLARSSPTPWIMPDEYIYAELSRSLADTGHFSVNGAAMATWSYGPLYPLLIAPAWLLAGSATSAYAAIQLINSILMSTAAVSAYYLGRRVLDKQLSFFLALLAVLVPSMVYSSKAMTESLAYPVFLAAVLAITVALERPTRRTQGLALLVISVALLTRAEMVMLIPAFLTGIVLVSALEGGGRRAILARLAAFRLTLSTFGALFLAGFAWSLARGSDVLGAHGHWLHVFDPLSLPRWLLIYIGELDLYVGIVPFAAFVLMLALAGRRDLLDRRARAVVAIAGSCFFWFVLLIATYSTQPRPNPAVHDRYVFYVVPLVLLVFLLWISLGAPRPRKLALAAGAVAFVAPAAIPFAEFLNGRAWGVSSSTVALVPWGLLKPALGAHGQLLAVIMCLSAIGVAAFLLVRPKRSVLLRFAVVFNFLFITLFVLAANTVVAEKAKARWVAPNPSWVDDAVGPQARVVGIWAEPADGSPATRKIWDRWSALFETQLTNTSVDRLYAFDDAYDLVALTHPFTGEALSDGQGRLGESGAPISADYAIVGPELALTGTQVAEDPSSGLLLVRLSGSGPSLR
jgi:4-amino-4-deoxy-L-arabinose transferase-like glycosyltransferase